MLLAALAAGHPGDGRGVEDSTFTLGRIVNCRIGLDVWCATATAWNTSIRYYGGHFACATGVNAALDRFGVRFGNAPGAYSNHNRHVFDAPNFGLRQAGSNLAIPFLNGIHPAKTAGAERRRRRGGHRFWSAMSSLRLSMPRMVKPSVSRSSVS
jgi:hypothetical protein